MRGLKFLVLGVAIAAGVGAVALVRSELERARSTGEGKTEVVQAQKAKVLVASRDMKRGETLKPEDLRWQSWPLDLVAEAYTTQAERPDALEKASEFMVKSPFVAGEPVTESKLIKINHPGVMSAMVRHGFRAMAIEVSLETGAGGFILPGDYVDVILTRRDETETRRSDGTYRTTDILITNTLLKSVRVMAIDTVFQTEGEATTSTKRTATLEVTPDMAELLSLAEEAGRMTLALRSLAELVGPDGVVLDEPKPEMVVDAVNFAGGSLPSQLAEASTADSGERGDAPSAGAAPVPAPSPVSQEKEILMVKGGVKQRAPIE